MVATRPPLEIAVKIGNRDESELAALAVRETEINNQINELTTERTELHRQGNLVSAALAQLQKDWKAGFHSEIWAIYEEDFSGILQNFETVVGKLMVAQMGRTGIQGDFAGIVNWLVQRGEMKSPDSCFREEIEKVGIFSNI